MATYNQAFHYNPSRRKKQRYALIERVVDFSNQPRTGSANSNIPIYVAWAAGDVLEAIRIKAGQTVLGVTVELMEFANVNNTVLKVGYGTDTDFWGLYKIDQASGRATGVKSEGTGERDDAQIRNFAKPLYFSSADTIDLTINQAITAGKVRIIVHLLEDDR